MADTGRKRPWLAALLALVYPGLGHLYLRMWARSLMWFGLMMSVVFLALPEAALQPADGGFGAAIQNVSEAVSQLSLESQLLLATITGLQVVDAYVLAHRSGQETDDSGPACPSCGKELDEELDFCPWCTTRLDAAEEA
ncbi:zinc ribbon domain-containing protein [Halobacteriales archaeon QS_1_68_20]|nr:MAG: zinc ribbon domain-containing protein [Halobacteriales archaeon QS_1_68_20]